MSALWSIYIMYVYAYMTQLYFIICLQIEADTILKDIHTFKEQHHDKATLWLW